MVSSSPKLLLLCCLLVKLRVSAKLLFAFTCASPAFLLFVLTLYGSTLLPAIAIYPLFLGPSPQLLVFRNCILTLLFVSQ